MNDRDLFLPGLKPRGHEDVLYATPRELLASLPAPAEASERGAPDDKGAFESPSDRDEVRTYLRRHGHRRHR